MTNKHIIITVTIIFLTLVGLYAISAVTSVVDPQTGEINAKNLKDYLHTSSVDLMLSKEQNLPTYETFLKDLEKICPYYEPDGSSYRECLYNLLEKKDKKVISVSNDLVKDVEIVILEKKTNPDEMDPYTSYFGEQYFLTSFAELQKSWKSYRNSLCEADHSTSFDGSNIGGFIVTCKLYETEKYTKRLIGYRYDWVRLAVQYYLDNGIQPKTSGFRALIERERHLGDF